MGTGIQPEGPSRPTEWRPFLDISFTMKPLYARARWRNMARPRVPTHQKPVPTTISLLRSHREWMDEGSLSPSALVNRLISEHRADNDSTREARRGLERAERTLAAIRERDDEALEAAIGLVAEQISSNRLAAMLLARLQNDVTDIKPVIAEQLTTLLGGFVVNETPEPTSEPSRTGTSCTWLVHNGRRQCKRMAVSISPTTGQAYCNQHADMDERWD